MGSLTSYHCQFVLTELWEQVESRKRVSWESPPGNVSECFPLDCVTNSTLGRAPKCWQSPGKGVPPLSLLLTPPPQPPAVASAEGPAQDGKACAWLSENHTSPTHLGHCSQACHMLLDPGKILCLEFWNKNSLKIPLSNVHGANHLEGEVFKMFCSLPSTVYKKRSGWVDIWNIIAVF